MAIRSKEEILESIKAKFADDSTDEAISIIEDINDTLADLEAKTADATDWKAKAEQIDAEWREKYKERFFSGPVEDDKTILEPEKEVQDTDYTYENLFKED